MPTFTMTHEINCGADRFWELFFDRTFNDKLYKEGLGFPQFEVLSQDETDSKIDRKAKGQPKLSNMPGPVAKLLGSGFGYTEEGTFDKATKTWAWKMTPSTLADKLKQTGKLRVEASGDKVKRIVELTVEAKIFGVGGLVEKTAEKSLREGWDNSAVYMNEYLKQNA